MSDAFEVVQRALRIEAHRRAVARMGRFTRYGLMGVDLATGPDHTGLLMARVVPVQPMTARRSQIYYLDHIRHKQRELDDADVAAC